jgi:hypothetical protein
MPNFWGDTDFGLKSFDPRQKACPLGLCQGRSSDCNAASKCLIRTLSFVVCLFASVLRSFRGPRVYICQAGSKFMPLLGHFKHLTFGRIMWPCWFGLPLLRCGCNTTVSWDYQPKASHVSCPLSAQRTISMGLVRIGANRKLRVCCYGEHYGEHYGCN